MSWWKRRWRRETAPISGRLARVRLTMQGWNEQDTHQGMRMWRNPHDDVLSLAVTNECIAVPDLSDKPALHQWCRELVESRAAGLIEVRALAGTLGPCMGMIYKRLEKPAYFYTGMIFIPNRDVPQIWTVVSGEGGTTGVREAVITADLVNAGEMSIEDYESSWAQEPYDPSYCGVDRSVLRFVSDDESYDERFPEHPLSKVRRVFGILPSSVQIEQRTPEP